MQASGHCSNPDIYQITRSSVIERLIRQTYTPQKKVAVIFAYLKHNEQLTLWDVIVALVRQLIECADTTLLDLVEKIIKDHDQPTLPTLDDVVELLREMLKTFEEQFISLDGIDEMLPEHQVKLLDIVLSLEARILIMSRPLPIFKARLERQELQKPVFYEVVANPVDLDLFITDEINKAPGLLEMLDEHHIRKAVMDMIKEKADGM